MPAPGDITDEFVVRPYTIGDRARLIELLQQVWPNRHPIEPHVDRRWWWQFQEPPLIVVEDRRSGRLAGLCAYMPFTLHSRGRERPAAWFVDFYVRQEHQGRGFGRRLTEAVQDRFSLTASLSQTAMAWRVFQKLGWRGRARVSLSMHPWPKRWMFPEGAECRIVRSSVEPGLSVAGDVDAFWARVSGAYPAIAVRTSAALVRRYAATGDRRYEIVCGYRGADCAGYAILRLVRGGERQTGLLVDVLTRPDDEPACAALVSAASRRLVELGAARLYCLATTAPMRRVLGRRGFLSPETPIAGWRLRSQHKWLTWFAADPAGVPDPAEWFLTLGDCDLDASWTED